MNSIQIAERVRVIDSHTGGEPTRVVVEGGPDLGEGSMEQRREVFRQKCDAWRAAVVNEPRGWEAMVGALLCPPSEPDCTAGVLFFNNVGPLGMCVHGTIGVMVTLAYLQRITPGRHRLQTPVGTVTATLEENGQVSVENVRSFRHAAGVSVDVEGHGPVTGDVAWGGNWFFLVNDHGQSLHLENVEALTQFAWRVRQALGRQGITGAGGQEIDHVELFGASQRADSRNFVLCPGKAYDRSPCGTGTSAKLACLAAAGKLQPGQIWRQESIVGSVFEGSYLPSTSPNEPGIWPCIRGTAHVMAEATLLIQQGDPFAAGIGGLPHD